MIAKAAILKIAVGGLGLMGLTLQGHAADSKTNYDRTQQGARSAPWEQMELAKEPEAVKGFDTEVGSPRRSVDSGDTAILDPLYNKLNENTDWQTYKNKVDQYQQTSENLDMRVERLENLDYNWEALPSSAGDWEKIGISTAGSWSPEISNQLSEFTQSRTNTYSYQREVVEKEHNIVTGEVRMVSSYIETDYRDEPESRAIDIQTSGWTNSGSVYGCSWSPSPSIVPKGESFIQEGTDCEQDQTRTVSYTLASTGESVGSSWTDARTRYGLTDSRTETGTKQLTWVVVESVVSTNDPTVEAGLFYPHFENEEITYEDSDKRKGINPYDEEVCSPEGDYVYTGRVIHFEGDQAVLQTLFRCQ